MRRAEARYMAMMLRNTLETSAQWGAVRVIPAKAEFVDVIVNGRIVRSSGKELALEVTVKDSTGRTWFENKKYESEADIGSYLSDAALKPLMIGHGLEVPMPVILLGVIGGVMAYGLVGLFIGAVMLAVGYVLLLEWLGPKGAAATPVLQAAE